MKVESNMKECKLKAECGKLLVFSDEVAFHTKVAQRRKQRMVL